MVKLGARIVRIARGMQSTEVFLEALGTARRYACPKTEGSPFTHQCFHRVPSSVTFPHTTLLPLSEVALDEIAVWVGPAEVDFEIGETLYGVKLNYCSLGRLKRTLPVGEERYLPANLAWVFPVFRYPSGRPKRRPLAQASSRPSLAQALDKVAVQVDCWAAGPEGPVLYLVAAPVGPNRYGSTPPLPIGCPAQLVLAPGLEPPFRRNPGMKPGVRVGTDQVELLTTEGTYRYRRQGNLLTELLGAS